MAGRDPRYYGIITGGRGTMPDERLTAYCLLFTQSKSLLYDLYSDHLEASYEHTSP